MPWRDTVNQYLQAMALNQDAETVHETLYNTFKYSEKELLNIDELLKNRDEASTLFYKTYFDLEAKKDKAFNACDFSKTIVDLDKVKIPKEELLKNKIVTKYLMFPDV